jgi:hypothetical protein
LREFTARAVGKGHSDHSGLLKLTPANERG